MSKISLVLCDWNGTIIEDSDEARIFRFVGSELLKRSLPSHPLRFIKLLRMLRGFEKLYKSDKEWEAGTIEQGYEAFRKKVVAGISVADLRKIGDSYAEEAYRRLDGRNLETIREIHREGKSTGILSIGYGYGIESILRKAGYADVFDFIRANGFQEEAGFIQEYRFTADKKRWLEQLIAEYQVSPDEVAYIGDSKRDEQCFEIVGHPLVAFFAPQQFKEYCAEKFGPRCVPQDAEELLSYLRHH